MSHYFDKNFFKFLVGFVAIIGISYLIIVAANLYQTGQTQTATASIGTAQ